MSRILEKAWTEAKALHDAGSLGDMTMREIETLCLPPVKRYTGPEIRAIGARSRVSQAVFARVPNVGTKGGAKVGTRHEKAGRRVTASASACRNERYQYIVVDLTEGDGNSVAGFSGLVVNEIGH